MATLKESLGEDFKPLNQALMDQGLSREERIDALRREVKGRKAHQAHISKAKEEVKATGLPEWYSGEGFGSRAVQSLAESGARLINLIPHAPYDPFFKSNEKLLKDGETIDNVYKLDHRDYKRQAEKEALNAEYAKAQGFGNKVQAGLVNLGDDLVHPSEWDTAGFITEQLADPANALVVGKGIVKGVALGAGLGGSEGYAFAASRSDKSREDAQVEGALGAIVGGAAGGLFGLMPDGRIGVKKADGSTESVDVAEGVTPEAAAGEEAQTTAKQQQNNNKTTDIDTSSIDDNPLMQEPNPEKVDENGMLIDPFDLKKSEPVEPTPQENFAQVIHEAEIQAVQEDEIIKAHAQQLAQEGVAPEIIIEQIDAKIEPTPDDLLVSDAFTDEGVELPKRMTGVRIIPMVLNEIAQPDGNPTAFYKRMRENGFDAELSGAAMQAVIEGRPEIFLEVAANKLNTAMQQRSDQLLLDAKEHQNAVETTAKEEESAIIEDKGVPNEPTETKDTIGETTRADRADDPTSGENGDDGKPEQGRRDFADEPRPSETQRGDGNDGTAVRDGGSDTLKHSDNDGLFNDTEPVAGQPTSRRDGSDIPESRSDTVVSDKVESDSGNVDPSKPLEGGYKEGDLVEIDGEQWQVRHDQYPDDTELSVRGNQEGLASQVKNVPLDKVNKPFKLTKEDFKDGSIVEGMKSEGGINDPNTGVKPMYPTEKYEDVPQSDMSIDHLDIQPIYNNPHANPDKTLHVKNLDLRESDPINLTKGGRKKINDQVEAILNKDTITEADAEILRQYTGKGGLESGTKDALNQHYTSYETIRGIYGALKDAGIKMDANTKALEPAVGAGNFVGHAPQMKWTTVDIDPVAHKIVSKLYPQAKHYNVGFESFKGKDFDLIISNVPFLETRGKGLLKDRSDVKALHDYYFVASLDKLKDNGVIAYVTSKGVMDKVDNSLRQELVSKADVIGAYRLPSGTFSKNAHTDVITDVIFLQKRPDGVESHTKAANDAFVISEKSADDIYINSYYEQNPSHILGEMKAGVNKMYGSKAYEISGKADYSTMKLNYKKYGAKKEGDTPTAAEGTSSKDTFLESLGDTVDSQEFMAGARDHGIEYYDAKSSGLKLDGDKVSAATKSVAYSDIEGGARIYEDISDTPNGKKILALEKIKALGDKHESEAGAKAIRAYQKAFKTHPSKDRSLNKLMREIGEGEQQLEYNSYFDTDFKPAQIFEKQTRYQGSGRMEVDASAPLKNRLLFNESDTGVIDFQKVTHLSDKDMLAALDQGYALVSDNQIQNDILYYSGNVYEKLDRLEALREKIGGISAYKRPLDTQRAKLEAIVPEPKTIDEIDISTILEDLAERKVFRAEKVEKWQKIKDNGGQKRVVKWESEFGSVFDKYMNAEALIRSKDGESAASYKRRLREAKERINNVVGRIEQRLREDETLRSEVEAKYNRERNFYVEVDHSKAQYLIDDVVSEIEGGIVPRPHQSAWVTKALYEGKGINAHDVGLGKTISGVMLARALKKRGAAQKPMIVAPAKVVGNWANNIKQMYPDAKVVNLGSLSKNVRTKRLFELSNSDADFVLISHEGFEQLRIPQEVELEYAKALLKENLKNDDLKGRALAVQEERMELYLEGLKKENDNAKITMDKLGIDAVIVDEARAFKNVGVSTKLVQNKIGKAFGMKVNGSKVTLDSARAYDFRFKTKYVSSKNNGRNIFILDATPTPNKPIELFTMLKHLDDNIFDEYGIKTDRDFAESFFEYGRVMNKTGGFDNGMSALKDALALRALMGRFVDRISMNEAKEKGLITIPDSEFISHMLEQGEDSVQVFEMIREAMKKLKDTRQFSKMMGVFSNAVNASADPRLYMPAQISDLFDATPENSKIEKVVDLVFTQHKADQKAGQIIFLDHAGHTATEANTVKVDGKEVTYAPTLEENLHQEIKKKLIKKGFKASEIAILSGQEITDIKTSKEVKGVSGDKSSAMKQAIVDAYDKGQIKVVIGTTKSAGEGMNIQKFTTDIYHLDMPWTMAEMIQRDGRGIRQGNTYKKVRSHGFFAQGTFDQLMYKTVMGKKGWNDALWDADASSRIEVENDGGGRPSIEEQAIAMETDPIKRRKMQLNIEYNTLVDENANLSAERIHFNNKIANTKGDIAHERTKIKEIEQKLESPFPTQALKELYEKATKEPKKYKAKYEAGLKTHRESARSFKEHREAKIPLLEKKMEKFKEQYAAVDKDFQKSNTELMVFEAKHVDDRGNIKSDITGEEC